MPINIRAGGTRKKSKPTARTRSSKSASSSRTIKRSGAHGKTSRTKTNTAETTTTRRGRSRTPQVSRAELKRVLRQFEKLGERREHHREEHKNAVKEQGELVSEYYDLIPPSMIAEALGVSVQWLYTQQKQLENGGPKPPLAKGQSYRTGRLTTIKGRKATGNTRKTRSKVGKTTSRNRPGRPKIRSRVK